MTATASRPPRRARVRRNRITERDATVVAAVALLSAVGGTLADAHPTAWRPADVVLTACFAGFVTWAGASSPWWALAGAAGFATVAAASLEWAIVAGHGVRDRRRHRRPPAQPARRAGAVGRLDDQRLPAVAAVLALRLVGRGDRMVIAADHRGHGAVPPGPARPSLRAKDRRRGGSRRRRHAWPAR